MSALLHLTDGHVAYGKVEAVRSVSLEIAGNEIVTIIGANGAGKTTLLNAIMGILPLKGRVSFAGGDLARFEIEDRVAASEGFIRAGLHAVSAAEGAAQAIGRHTVGRRATDAGDGPRADGRAQTLDAG